MSSRGHHDCLLQHCAPWRRRNPYSPSSHRGPLGVPVLTFSPRACSALQIQYAGMVCGFCVDGRSLADDHTRGFLL